MKKAPINKIIKFSNVDGPGNRTAIFLQVCPFNCLYCHNPETINLCKHCGSCIDTCPTKALSFNSNHKVVWNKKLCIDCDTCLKTCTKNASPKIQIYTSDALLTEILKQKAFIKGITTSGGECMVHAEFLLELFKKVKAHNLTCLIDSNGHYLFEKYPELLEISDGVMLDIKAYNNDFHKVLIGVSNNNVIKNLKYLLEHNKLQEVRTVLLPNHDDQNEETVRNVSKIIQGNVTYKLLRYRPFGVRDEGIKFIGNEIYSEEKAQSLAKLAIKLGASKTIVI